jgi:hypothetical protein
VLSEYIASANERLTSTAYDDVDEHYLISKPLYLITGERNFHRSLDCTD